MILLFMIGAALALSPLPERPPPPQKVAGECSLNFPISQGQLLPDGIASWCLAVDKRYAIDTRLLISELDWYKTKLAEETKQKPFLERPASQRWIGRIETLIVVGIVSASLGATYYYSSGAGK